MEQIGCLVHGSPAYAESERSAAQVAGGDIPRRHPESCLRGHHSEENRIKNSAAGPDLAARLYYEFERADSAVESRASGISWPRQYLEAQPPHPGRGSVKQAPARSQPTKR